jgi:hypothetical protein
MSPRPNRYARRAAAELAERSHPLSLTTREGVIVFEALLLVDLWLGRPESQAGRPYGPEHVETLRTKLIAAVPELESYAREATPQRPDAYRAELLADNIERGVFEPRCPDCGITFESAEAVVPHMATHGWK